MVRESTTILERFVNASFSMEQLYAAKENAYLAPLATLILASESVIAKACEPWEFKSLAQIGIEEFIQYGNFFGIDRWEKEAQKGLAECVTRYIYYEETEGLLFFVQDGNNKYRQARSGDDAYDFVRRLRDENSVSDLRFPKPPKWAEELFVGHENLEAYELMWSNAASDTSNPQYMASKKLRADAVIQETSRRMKSIHGLPEIDYGSNERPTKECDKKNDKPLATRQRRTLLTVIAAMCKYEGLDPQGRGTAQRIMEMTDDLGAHVDDGTIATMSRRVEF